MNSFQLKDIPQDALVLELGSGDFPWPRADVLVDRYIEDLHGQRAGQKIFLDKRPLVITPGERLPFRDKSFDFVYSSQVLDHAEDPSAMLREMSRVAKAGYLECSNPLMERFQNPPVHLWYVTAHEGRLFLASKNDSTNVTTEHDRFVFHLLSEHYIMKYYWSFFSTHLHWKDTIPFEICDVKTAFSLLQFPPTSAEFIHKNRTRALLRGLIEAVLISSWERLRNSSLGSLLRSQWKQFRKRNLSADGLRTTAESMQRLLACPHCGQSLSFSPDQIRCEPCNTSFKKENNVYFFDKPGET